MSFYENLFHDTTFHKQDPGTSMLGINLNMLDIFEIFYKYQKNFQQLCTVTVSGSISHNYNHYDIAIFEHELPELPFMRVSFRTCCIDGHTSTKNVVTLVGPYSIGVISSIVKYDYLNRLKFRVNQWFGVQRGLIVRMEPSIYF